MLRITFVHSRDGICLKLEGKLLGAWIEELSQAWAVVRDCPETTTRIVDLCGVTFVSAEGKRLLAAIAKEGAEFRAQDVMNSTMIADLVTETSS